MKRRDFLEASGAAAAALAFVGRRDGWAAPSEALRIGIVGVRGRGGDHLRGFIDIPGVQIAALCDVDEGALAARVREVVDRGKPRPQSYADMRYLFDDKTIDAVSFATPNHWHALGSIWACQAGKDVYVEKPCSHNLWEGRKLVEAARKYGRIVQHGTQCRSSAGLQEAVRHLREGLIGEVYMARALCYKWRDTIGKAGGEQPIPPGVDYDLWLGPAPRKPLLRKRLHYDWHWFWDYGNGDIGNQGVHQMDIARWGLGVTYPTRAMSMGAKFMFDDDQETPNTMESSFWFPEGKMLVFAVRHWITNHEGMGSGSSNAIGVTFYGSKGYLVIPSYTSWQSFLGKERREGPKGSGGERHYENFIEAVRTRRREILAAEIEEGHISSALCHLANVAYRVGRSIAFDPKTETIPGDEEANRLLRREYRKPFVVPEAV